MSPFVWLIVHNPIILDLQFVDNVWHFYLIIYLKIKFKKHQQIH